MTVTAPRDRGVEGPTLVAASFPPATEHLPTNLLYRKLSGADTVILVTADRPPAAVIESYEASFTGHDAPSLAIIDVTADQTFHDTYHDVTVVGIPGVGDITRTLVGISDVATDVRSSDGEAHVVIPDIAPFMGNRRTHVTRMFRSLREDDAITGSIVVGFQYTAASSETMGALQAVVDTIVWAEETPAGDVTLDRTDPDGDRELRHDAGVE